METGALGKVYTDGEIIIQQGDKGDCMYVIQEGQVEVMKETNGSYFRLAVLSKGDIFGDMSIIDHEVRMATVRAVGNARILTIDQQNFMRRVQEDPSMAYRLLQIMSGRVRLLGEQVARFANTLPDQSISPNPKRSSHGKIREFCKRQVLSIPRPISWLSLNQT